MNNTKQNNTKQNNTKQNNTKQNNTENFFTPVKNNKSSLVSKKSNKTSQSVLIIILILLLVISIGVVIYYLVKYIKNKRAAKTQEPTQTATAGASLAGSTSLQTPVNKNEVFHIANNKFTHADAEMVCKAAGAELATEEQIADAYEKGANWCSYGWVKSADGKSRAYYPIQQDFWNRIQNDESLGLKDQCGVPGINGGVFDKDVLFGVNCYGVKREPTTQESELTASLTSGDIADEQLAKYKAELADTIFAPFAPGKWSGL